MDRTAGWVLIALGVVLTIVGLVASESLSSEISELFSGAPSGKSIWLIAGGLISIACGAALSRRHA